MPCDRGLQTVQTAHPGHQPKTVLIGHTWKQDSSQAKIPAMPSDELGSLRQTTLLTAHSAGSSYDLCGCWMTLHSEGIQGEKQEEVHCGFGLTGLYLVTHLPQEKVQWPQILASSHTQKSMNMINLQYLISVFHSSLLPYSCLTACIS